MTLLLTSGSNHTIPLQNTLPPHRRGGANQKDHRSHSTGGGGDEAKQDQTGKATSPNKTTTHLTGKGGYHGEGGGRGGRGSPASYMIFGLDFWFSCFLGPNRLLHKFYGSYAPNPRWIPWVPKLCARRRDSIAPSRKAQLDLVSLEKEERLGFPDLGP